MTTCKGTTPTHLQCVLCWLNDRMTVSFVNNASRRVTATSLNTPPPMALCTAVAQSVQPDAAFMATPKAVPTTSWAIPVTSIPSVCIHAAHGMGPCGGQYLQSCQDIQAACNIWCLTSVNWDWLENVFWEVSSRE